MKSTRIPRRTLLRGLGGTAVALPFLEVMEQGGRRAHAAGQKRYFVTFAGTSLGQAKINHLVPTAIGPNYDVKRAVAPLGETNTLNKFGAYGLRNDVTIASGMKIPWAVGGATAPVGGRISAWHSSSISPLLSGVASTSRGAACLGPTSDQLAAAVLAQGARFRSLEYRVQASGYRDGGAKGVMSYRKDSTGKVIPNTPVASPKLAFDNLFSGFQAGGDPVEAKRREAMLAQDKSVLDVVRGNADRLRARLGSVDRTRLERHFEEIRDLEKRIATIPQAGGATCKVLTDPGPDPAIATTVEDGRQSRTIGWANEDLRGKVLGDLVHLAFACDLARSVSLMLTFVQCFMNVETLVGVRTDLHESGHFSTSLDKMSDTIAWQVGLWARIVAKLKETPDGGGGYLLDNTAAILVFEGGHGFDPESGTAADSHSSENMAVLVAGRVGGLKPGRHIATAGAHPAQAIVTCMNAVGVQGGLGDVGTGLKELLG
jgi:hypothetical protein